jgi:hypothetical protein
VEPVPDPLLFVAMIVNLKILLLTFSEIKHVLRTLLSVMGKATEVFITFSKRGVYLVTWQSLQTVTLSSNQ